MGGGGGSGGFTVPNLSALEKKAKEELRRGDTGRRNVFLSFAYEDIDDINLLRGQVKNERSDIDFNDWSVAEPFNSERADYIKQKIGERIRQSSLTVIYLSDTAAASKWVDWEIRESRLQGKEIIAVHKGGTAPVVLPPAIDELGIEVVPWSDLSKKIK
jgi:MTH538 TIR-like domain (DUF1863)